MVSGGSRLDLSMCLAWLLSASLLEAKMDLTRHSMSLPAPKEVFEEDWHHLGGARLRAPTGDISGVLLNAGEADHPSMLWSQEQVPSDDWEASFTMSFMIPNLHNDGFKYEGVAFWYVHDDAREFNRINHENEHKRRQAKVRGQRFGLYGYKNKFDGLGAFIFFDAGSPMLTALANDGTKNIKPDDVFEWEDGLGLYDALFEGREEEDHQHYLNDNAEERGKDNHYDDTNMMDKPSKKGERELQIKLRVFPTGANVTVVGHGTTEFQFEEHGLKPPRKGGVLGVTCVSHAARRDPNLKPIGVELKDLKVVSFVDVKKKPSGRHSYGSHNDEL